MMGFGIGGTGGKKAVAVRTFTSVTPALGNDRGGTAVTIVGSGFTGMPAAECLLGGAQLGSFSVVDDTHVTGTTAAHARGTVDIAITGATTASNAYEYLDALQMSGTTRAWWRADLGATVISGALDVLADQSGSGDANKNLTAPSSGLRPDYSASHASMNNRAAFGTQAGLDQIRNMASGTFAAAIARGYTVYHVFRIPAGAAAKDTYWRLGPGTLTNSAGMYGQAGASKMHASDGGSGEALFTVSEDVLYVSCTVYKAAGGCDVYLNQYNSTAGTGGSGTQSCASLTTGGFSPDSTRWLAGEIIIRDGEDNSAMRARIMRDYMGDAFAVTVTA